MITQDLDRLLALQTVDVGLDDVARREAEARARLAAAKLGLDAFRETVKQEKKLLDEALKEHKTVEIEIKAKEDQVKKYTGQMYEVKTNKEYTALKEEIDKSRAESSKLEDRLLQLMLKEDELKGAGSRRAAELAEKEREAKTIDAEVAAALAEGAKERADLEGRRAEKLGALGKALLYRYEQIRAARGGAPLARIVEAPDGGEAVCGGCHVTVRPQIVVLAARQEEMVFCESCARILYLERSPSPNAA